MIGWDHEHEEIRTYRLNRIYEAPEILPLDAFPAPEDFDVAHYTWEIFRMYDSQEPEEVAFLCCNEVMKGVIDKFGRDIPVEIVDINHFRTRVKVCLSPTFYSWVFQWDGKIRIEGLEEAANGYRETVLRALG